MFLVPFTASATLTGSGVMKVDYSTPIAGGYYTEHAKTLYAYTAGQIISFASTEVFCVENEPFISPIISNFYTTDGVGVRNNKLLGTWAANFQNVSINDRLLAVSFSDKGNTNGQNYPVKATRDPEPATMLFCGTGLVSLAGMVRNRRRKKSAVKGSHINEFSSPTSPSQISQYQDISAIA